MADQSEDRRSPIILMALLVTAIFLVLFAWLLSRTTTCAGGWWLWHRLDCLEPNALGDTFAGAFAPVAFVWLVAAVMLQRNELSAQRQELREARSVAMQQVEEAKKNVELISVQTKILEADQRSKLEHEADQDILELVRTAVGVFRFIAGRFSVKWFPDDGSEDFFPFESSASGIENNLEGLEFVLEKIHELFVEIELHYFENKSEFHFRSEWMFERLVKVFELIDVTAKLTSVPMQAELARLGLDDLSEQLSVLLTGLRERGKDSIP